MLVLKQRGYLKILGSISQHIVYHIMVKNHQIRIIELCLLINWTNNLNVWNKLLTAFYAAVEQKFKVNFSFYLTIFFSIANTIKNNKVRILTKTFEI